MRRLLPAPAEWLVPTIVQLELYKWVIREIDEATADRIIAFTRTCVVVDLDTRLATSAAALGAVHKLSTADAIIYATAREWSSNILTCDAHFEGLAGVSFIAKQSS